MWIFDEFMAWFEEQMIAAIEFVFQLVVILLMAPQVYNLPQVAAIRSQAMMIVNTGFMIAILVAGVVVMTRGTLQQTYGPAELLPRLLIGLLAANFSDPIIRLAIDATNALLLALTGGGVTTDGSLEHITGLWMGEDPVTGQWFLNWDRTLLQAIIFLTIIVLLFQLLIGWFVRLGVLILLAGVAPVALALHATPWTDGAARLWWRTLFGCLGTVLLQGTSLYIGGTVLLDQDASLTAMGVPGGDEVDLLIFLVILLITMKIPGLMARYLTGTGGRSHIGWLLMWAVSHARGGGGRRRPPSGTWGRAGRWRPDPGGGDQPGSPTGPRGPQPNQPPTFSHRPRLDRPRRRPKDLKPMPVFSHRQPTATPARAAAARAEPVFSDFTPPYPADGSHPAWKPITTPASVTPAVGFSHLGTAPQPAAAAPAPAVRQFSHPPTADRPRPRTPPSGVEREPHFSHSGRRVAQSAVPTSGTAHGGSGPQARPDRWPSVAVFQPSSPARTSRRPAGPAGGSRATTADPAPARPPEGRRLPTQPVRQPAGPRPRGSNSPPTGPPTAATPPSATRRPPPVSPADPDDVPPWERERTTTADAGEEDVWLERHGRLDQWGELDD